MGKDLGVDVAPSPDPAHGASTAVVRREASFNRFSPYLGTSARVTVAFFGLVLDVLMLGLTAASVFVAATLTDLPETAVLKDVRLKEPLRIFSADGALMAEFGVQRRSPVSFDEIPPQLVKAFLATEDSRFFEHEGVDLRGIGRAAVNYAQTGERSQGGSTITMQLARNFFLSREKNFQRKFAELLLSLHVERTLTKEEILELYLNKIFFGHRAYGISAAAALYYDKTLEDLEIAEMAMLAGIPKAPSADNPVTNPERAHERRNYVLRRMRDLAYISDEEFLSASAVTDQAKLHRKEVDLEAGYAAEMVRLEMVDRFSEDAYRDGYRVTTTFDSRLQSAAQEVVRGSLRAYDRRHGYQGAEDKHDVSGADDEQLDLLLESVRVLPDLTAGIVVEAGAKEAKVYIGKGRRVTLALKQVKWARPLKNERSAGRVPRKVTDALAVGDLIRVRQVDEGTWGLSQIPSVAGALVSLSPQDGAVRALVGGYAFEDSKFNRAVDARRQPGSSFKPFVYAAALNKGYTPASRVRDVPFSRGSWRPQNFDRRNMGIIRMREALTLSRNLASIDLLNRVGLNEATQFIRRFGFDEQELPLGLSMALGTAEVSPLQMAGAYALFANGGFRVIPYFISRVENGAGEVVFEANAVQACADCWARYEGLVQESAPRKQADLPLAEQVLDPRIAYQMTSMMQDVIEHGTGVLARKLNRKDIAGKTGTTNDVRDSWFCGYQKDLVTIAWMGFDEPRPLGKEETGSQAAIRMWVDFMRDALKDKPLAILDPPEGMVKVRLFESGGGRNAGGSLEEWMSEEHASSPQGPRPVGYAHRATHLTDERL